MAEKTSACVPDMQLRARGVLDSERPGPGRAPRAHPPQPGCMPRAGVTRIAGRPSRAEWDVYSTGTSEESHILGILEASKRLVDAAIHSTMERCRVGGPGAGGAPTTQRGPGPVPEPAPPTVTSRSPCFTDQAEAPSLSELARTVLMLRCHVRCL